MQQWQQLLQRLFFFIYSIPFFHLYLLCHFWLFVSYCTVISTYFFLLSAIGTDNMFLMLKSWRMTKKSSNEEQRYIHALTESAASLFLTSLTDGLSFAIGSISDFHAVSKFFFQMLV